MKTELLFIKDSYLKEFDANVIDATETYVVLDKTAFYYTSSGQNCDKGKINGREVIKVVKEDNEIKHYTSKPIKDKKVHCVIDWQYRYKHMRMHSAQHLLSSIVLDKFDASTVGNQIEQQYSRMDFCPFKPTKEDILEIEKEFNNIIDAKKEIKIYFTTREDVLATIDPKRRRLFAKLPEFIKEIRVVEIVGIDKCPCAGAHVKNTSEIGHIKNIKTENKGKDRTRLVFELG